MKLALLALCGALGLALGCENDVAVHLLSPAPKPSASADPPDEPDPPDPPDPPVCVPGEPCSGLVRALYFHGAYDRVEIPSSSGLDLPQDFTMETWVLIRSYDGGHGILNRWIPGVGDIELTFGTPEPLPQLELQSLEQVPSHVLASWGFVRPEYWITVAAPSLPSEQVWHHVAAVYGSGSYRLYVDGAVTGSVLGLEPVANPQSTLYLGATARHERAFDPAQGTLYWPPIDGFIADVRLSGYERYTADFEPDARLSADSGTLALWHLDEGSGATAADSGERKLNGSITGASWELAPRRGAL